MKKIYLWLSVMLLSGAALCPPINVPILVPNNKSFLWLFLIFGFLGFYTLFLKISPFIKALSIYAFINSFFSGSPLASQEVYIILICCVYFYVMCSNIEQWKMISNCLLILLLMNVVMLFIQYWHKDNLLNFGLKHNTCFGIVGNPMQLKSFFIVCIGFLIALNKIKLKISAFFITAAFASVYLFWHKVFQSFLYARGSVWLKTIQLSWQHPFMGYGIGTYKILFPPFSGRYNLEGTWMNAHNFWAQIYFEMGLIGLLLIALAMAYLFYRSRKNISLLIGLILVNFSLMVHFPERQSSTLLILVAFFAFIQREVKHG